MSTSASEHDMSDSSSSGASYMKYSPYNSPSQQVPQLTTELTELTCVDKRQFLQHATKPFLRIIVQPQNHFRFRYISEMVGTHGCLLGKTYGNNKTKTHPTVELANYQGQALIRCHLAQFDNPEDHPHKLLEDEQDRDVSQLVPELGSYKVAFGGIGIIHTAKKDVSALLVKKFMETNKFPNISIKDDLLFEFLFCWDVRLLQQLLKQQLFNTYDKAEEFVCLNALISGTAAKQSFSLQSKCDNIAKSINLNIVRLKFSAHDVRTDEEICEPVFSELIHNMKSASTNDLKICRMSSSTGSANGNEDVFILVEKVNKKNVMIRFFELDQSGERIWEGVGKFVQTDVHHQYAIVFRTPPYRDCKTPVDVEVFIELVRPSDGRTSEPKSFKYRAEPVYMQMKKRKANSSTCSIGSSCGSLNSNSDIPITVMNQDMAVENAVPTVPSTFSMNQMLYPTSPSQCDLASALAGSESSQSPMSSPMWSQPNSVLPPTEPTFTNLQINSTDFEMLQNTEPENRMLSEGMTQFFSEYLKTYNEEYPGDKVLESLEFRPAKIVKDSPRPMQIKLEGTPEISSQSSGSKTVPGADVSNDIKSDSNKSSETYNAFYNTEDGLEVKKLVKDLCDMMRNKKVFKRQEVRSRLDKLFNIRLSNGDTFLHMTLCSNQSTMEYIVKLIHNVRATHLLDYSNYKKQTPLHLAILNDMPRVVTLLISRGANPMLKDTQHLNAIHYAVKYNSCLEPLLDAIKKNKVACDLNDTNSENQSALYMAVVSGSHKSADVLLRHGASYKVRDSLGRSPLHIAAYDDRLDVINTLLKYMSEVDVVDEAGNTALQIVCGGQTMRENTLAIAKILLERGANPSIHEHGNESACRLVRHKPELKKLLEEYVDPDIMDEDDIKSEPEDDFESADEGESEICLQELNLYSHEVSTILDATGAWRILAKRLRLDALLDWYATQTSPTLTLLNHLKESRDDITSKSLILILDEMGYSSAANVIRRCIE